MEAFFALIGIGLAAWVFLGPLFVLWRLRQTNEEIRRARREIGELAVRLFETERRVESIRVAGEGRRESEGTRGERERERGEGKVGDGERKVGEEGRERRVGKECRSRWSPYH